MFQRDYIMRMIEHISHIVGTMLGFKQNREPKEALFYIDEYFKRLLGMSSKLLTYVTDSALLDLLRQGSDAGNDNILVTATLFKEEGDVLLMLGESTAAYHRHCRALFLYLTAVLDEPKRDYDEEIAIVLAALRPFAIPPAYRRQLWRYNFARGRYAEAENELFKLIDDGHGSESLLEEAIDSYTKLLALNEDELQHGGLSLQEVQEAIEQLERKRSLGEHPTRPQ